jgi:hypothetical protein
MVNRCSDTLSHSRAGDMSSQPHHGGRKESCGKSHKKQSKVIWESITILKMSTGYLVLELGDPFVSCDGCCPEDLNNSRSFGVAEGITASILDLSKDRTKHDPARVVAVVVGTLLG